MAGKHYILYTCTLHIGSSITSLIWINMWKCLFLGCGVMHPKVENMDLSQEPMQNHQPWRVFSPFFLQNRVTISLFSLSLQKCCDNLNSFMTNTYNKLKPTSHLVLVQKINYKKLEDCIKHIV